MNKGQQWKLLGIILLAAACIWLIWPPFTVKDKDGNVVEKGKINLGLDLQGGMHIVLKVDTSKLQPDAKRDAVDRAILIIRNRIDKLGVGEMQILRQGKDNIIVEMPGMTDRDRALKIIGDVAHLEFKIVSDNSDDIKKAINNEPVEGWELKYYENEKGGSEPLLLEKEASLTGDMVVKARTDFSSKGFGEPYVSLTLNAKGAKIFADVTAANVGKRLAIVLDDKVRSAPVIREAIPSGQAQISGSFSAMEANDLANMLESGALPAPIVVEEERTVGPLLGADSIKSGVRAGIIGTILVIGFMFFYYRLAGIVANMALILNVLITMAGLALISKLMPSYPATLTLPGIAGLVLTIGMSVDANVLIYERIREELHLGKTLRAALAAGYHRAFSAILDSNLTTIFAAAILFFYGTGPIKGFAVTLTIGLLANLFTAVVCTRVVFEVLIEQFNLTKLRFMNIFRHETKIDFISKRRICYVGSAIIIIAGIVLFAMRGEKNFGVDFSGGTLQQYGFEKPVNTDSIRKILKELGYANAAIQQYGDAKEIIIRTPDNISTKLNEAFKIEFADNPFHMLKVEMVGPAVGKQLRQNAIISLFLGLAAIAIYIMFRFDLKYGIAGVIALIHDVFFAIGAMAITHRQFDLTIVAALLTIAGYSINDTVVIYDRIRENLRVVKKGSFIEIVNLSVNQMLGRTILTTGVTMLAVISLLAFGGEVLNDFSFCIFVGFFVGVYSTIYIASPMVISWHRKIVAVKPR